MSPEQPQNPKQPINSPLPGYRLIPEDQYVDPYAEDEIDLLELAKKIWDERWLIVKFLVVGAIVGVLVAITRPKEYVSSATLMPEYTGSNSGGGASSLLRQFGGLAGVDVGGGNSSGETISVSLYPDIVQSVGFQHTLAQQSFHLAEYDTTASLYAYFLELEQPGAVDIVKKYTIGLPGILLSSIRFEKETEEMATNSDSGILSLPRQQMGVISNLRSRVSASLDQKSGIITVSAKFGNPQLAAQIAKYTIDALTQYLVEYRTEKVQRDLSYLKEQLAQSKKRFDEAQLALAQFKDSNRGTLTNRAQTEEQRLNSEYSLAFNLYNSFMQRYEATKVKLQEETPVFKVLQPVLVPVQAEGNRKLVIIVSIILFGMLSLGWIFGKEFIGGIKKNESNS